MASLLALLSFILHLSENEEGFFVLDKKGYVLVVTLAATMPNPEEIYDYLHVVRELRR